MTDLTRTSASPLSGPAEAKVVLDHVAIAVRDWSDAEGTLGDVLQGEWQYGLRAGAFDPCQIGFGNDTRVELLQPPPDRGSFVTEFLADRGRNAPHHITFKTDAIVDVLDRMRSLDIEPILVSLDKPTWKEAFLHPRTTGLGVLIQIAQSQGDPIGSMPPSSMVPPSEAYAGTVDAPAFIDHILLEVADVDGAERVFCAGLGGTRVESRDKTTRIAWPSGADLVLTPSGGARAGGVLALTLSGTAPERLAVREGETGCASTDTLDDLGLRLQFQPV